MSIDDRTARACRELSPRVADGRIVNRWRKFALRLRLKVEISELSWFDDLDTLITRHSK